MKLLIASDSFAPKIDGVAITSGTIARMLARRGHDVLVIAPGPGPVRGDGYPIMRTASVPFPLYSEVRVALPWPAIGRAIRHFQPDSAVVLTPGVIGAVTVRALPRSTRMIHIYTTDIPRYLRAYSLGFLCRPAEAQLQRMCTRALTTLCPTEKVRADMAARHHPKLSVWGRGVDLDLFHPARCSATMRLRLTGNEPEKPLVLYVGRLAREKRLLDLYEAARQLPGVRFALVGDGPDRDLLERCFSRVPSVFTGFLTGVPLAEAFASADVFAFPSDSDTFGQVVLQAMASGLPPVVVAGTAPAEFVPDRVAGLHIPAHNPRALACAIDGLIRDRSALTRMAGAAREHALRFAWGALMDRLETLLTTSYDPLVATNVVAPGAPKSAGRKRMGKT